MKILHVSHRFWPCLGGVETHIKQLCENLVEKDLECSVVCLNKCPNSRDKLSASDFMGKINIQRIGFLELGFYKIAPGIFGKFGNNDIVHVHGLGYFLDKLAATKIFHKRKLVLSTHGGIFHTKNLNLLKKIYFFGWCRLALRAFDKVIAVSKADYELFRKIVPAKKIVLFENPVEIEKFGSLKRQEKPNSFLFVGRLSKNKGFKELFKTFALLKEKGLFFSLTIAGRQFDLGKEELQKRAKDLGIGKEVNVLGEVNEKRLLQLFSENQFFVSASKYEGFGISAVEAMAAGLIPVLNDIAPFRRFVKNGENGFIAGFGNSEKASDEIEKAIRSGSAEKKRMAGSAKASTRRFSWHNNISKFEKLYLDLLVQN